MRIQVLLFPILVLILAPPVQAARVNVAVASNFLEVVERMQRPFLDSTGHQLVPISGSTGQLAGQIRNGAPYDVLLAADARRPRLLEQAGMSVPGTRFVYAVGRLVLWAPDRESPAEDMAAVLEGGGFRSLAMANPDLAPYGLAAQQTLQALSLWETLRGKVVLGQNIGQVYSLIHTGNAELGFVALSQVLAREAVAGSIWHVPPEMHDPITQEAMLLVHGADNPAASAFLDFLRGNAATELIHAYGYRTGRDDAWRP